MKKFRFAILGAGHIARQFCDAVSRIDGCEVCAVASKSLARAENFAKENGVESYYDDYETLLEKEKTMPSATIGLTFLGGLFSQPLLTCQPGSL